ncbi:heavy-metal-associated domain-containing protein [Flavobacterium sp.]
MKFTSSILTLALSTLLFIGCKETNSKAEESKTITSTTEIKKNIIAAKPETASFTIDGMSCAIGCAKTIEKKLAATQGVQEAKVDFDKKQATVNFDADVISPEKLQEIVEKAADGKTYTVSAIKIKA